MAAADDLRSEPLVRELLDRCRFPAPGTAVTCAVSGGADSLALLVLAVAAGCEVTAVHVDHGLRAGSAAEADVVAAACARVGARFESRRVEVDPGPNLEARARQARYGVLPPDVLTGHTLDDQAETLVLNLLRGAGVDGLSGIDRPGRPLLGLRRAETEAVCAALGLEPVVDPSNRDPAFRRNRVRHEVLPLLDDVAGRDVAPLLARLADHAADVRDLLAELSSGIDPTDTRALRAASPVLAAAALRQWLRVTNPDGRPPDRAAIERVLAVVRGEVVATELAGGWRVARSGGRLTLTPPDAGGRAN